jgi:hypothetical protein
MDFRMNLSSAAVLFGVATLSVAQDSRPESAPATAKVYDLSPRTAPGTGVEVTLTRTVKGRLRPAGSAAASVFDEKTVASWFDLRASDANSDRRIVIDSRTTIEGRPMDSGDAGMAITFDVASGSASAPDRVLTPRRLDRLARQASFAHLRLPMPAAARAGETFAVDPAGLIAGAFDIADEIREPALSLTVRTVDAKTGFLRLEGSLTFAHAIDSGVAALEIRHVLDVVAEFDLGAARLASIVMKGKARPTSLGGAKTAETGEIVENVALATKKIANAADWKPPSIAFRENVHRALGLEFKLPSYWIVAPLDAAIDYEAGLKFHDSRHAPAPTLRFFQRANTDDLGSAEHLRDLRALVGDEGSAEAFASALGRGAVLRLPAPEEPASFAFVVDLPDGPGRMWEIAMVVPKELRKECEGEFDRFIRSIRRIK